MSTLAKQAVESVIGQMGPTESWQTMKFQTNDVKTEHLLYGCLCPPCALASAKSASDQSNWLFNLLCFPPQAAYSMVRYGYGIKGECGDDMLYGTFCMPCLARQAYTETQARGVIPGQKYGAMSDEWHFGLTQCECTEFCLALACPCYVANGVRKVLHPTSDTWFNILCMVPCAMYGTVRHTYGLRSEFPHPVCEDLCVGAACYPCALNRAAKEAPYQRTTGKVNSAIESAHKAAEGMKSSLKNAVKMPGSMK
eukprot:PhM_4_TR3005/c1_g1_i1/m.37583